MRLIAIFLFIISSSLNGYTQICLDDFTPLDKKRFSKIRLHIKKASSLEESSVEELGKYLQQIAITDLEKSYAAFYWVSDHITYDMKSFLAGKFPSYRPQDVMKSKLAVCSGYAHLFKAIATQMKLQSEILDGYSKGYGYDPNEPISVSNHSWNSVFINGKWYLLDATWAAPKSNDRSPDKGVNEKFFLMNPKEFLQEHLPEDPKWQLISPQIALSDFNDTATLSKQSQYALVINDDIEHIEKYVDIGTREVALQKRILAFNPKNSNAVYKLGVALLYKGEDIMEQMHELSYANVLTEIPEHKYRAYELFDQAALHFQRVREGPTYESAQTFLSQTIYQKGVFNYEASQIIYDTTVPLSIEEYMPIKVSFSEARIAYYEIATEYFSKIEPTSWYYENSQDYLRRIEMEKKDVKEHIEK